MTYNKKYNRITSQTQIMDGILAANGWLFLYNNTFINVILEISCTIYCLTEICMLVLPYCSFKCTGEQ